MVDSVHDSSAQVADTHREAETSVVVLRERLEGILESNIHASSWGGDAEVHGIPEAMEGILTELTRQAGGWADLATIPERPGHYDVRSVTTYRWLPYKVPQGGRKGRWQEATEYGWTNAKPPRRGDWKPNVPLKATPVPSETQPGTEREARSAPSPQPQSAGERR